MTPLTLVLLSDLALLGYGNIIQEKLENYGYGLTCSNEWLPLAGNREYSRCEIKKILIEGRPSDLILEINRSPEAPENTWSSGFELRPRGSAGVWSSGMRQALLRNYRLVSTDNDGMEHYTRNSLRQILFYPGSDAETPYLLLHSGDELRR